jgi:hypothetical protein
LLAETLPVSVPLVDLGAGPTLLARAAIPDPCFWSPDLPAIYDVVVELRRGGQTIATEPREVGLRALGVRGRNFYLDGKKWVLRGVLDASAEAAKLPDWQQASATLICSSTKGEILDRALSEASQVGTLAMVEVPRGEAGLRELAQLARNPSVGFAIAQRGPDGSARPSEVAPNILLVQRFAVGDELVPQSWAQAFLADGDDPSRLMQIVEMTELPIIVARPLSGPRPIAAARAACDVLQRDLAALGQFAGYIV